MGPRGVAAQLPESGGGHERADAIRAVPVRRGGAEGQEAQPQANGGELGTDDPSEQFDVGFYLKLIKYMFSHEKYIKKLINVVICR